MGTIVVSIVFLSLGTCLGYPTKALPDLQSESNIDVKLNENELSILAAIPTLSGVIYCPIGGIISGWLGRKTTILSTAPLVACGWLIIALAQNKAMLFIGHFLMSTVMGLASTVTLPYIAGKLITICSKFI